MNPPLPPEPPQPPSVGGETESSHERTEYSPLDDLGMDQSSFAELAANSQVEWDGEHMDQLELMMSGELVSPEVQEELLQELTSPKQRKQPEPIHHETTSDIGEEDIDLMPAQPAPVMSLVVPTSSINLDDWLRKNKG